MIKEIKLGLLTIWFISWFLLGNVVAYRFAHRNDEYKIVRGAVGITTDDYLLENRETNNWWKLVSESSNPVVAMYILTVFKDPEWILVAKAESGLRADAVNWNCMYGSVSRSCNLEDRGEAWSVDCGVMQLNFSGKTCPKESFDPVWNVDRGYEKYLRQGKSAWVATWGNAHLE